MAPNWTKPHERYTVRPRPATVRSSKISVYHFIELTMCLTVPSAGAPLLRLAQTGEMNVQSFETSQGLLLNI